MKIPFFQTYCLAAFLCLLLVTAGASEANQDTSRTVAPTTAPLVVSGSTVITTTTPTGTPMARTPQVGYIEISSVPTGAEVDLWDQVDHINPTRHTITPATFEMIIGGTGGYQGRQGLYNR